MLIAFNWSIYAKEQLKANGQPVLLALAPVDPRSLMQGDYMRLNYQVATEAGPFGVVNGLAERGYIVVAVDPATHVASYRRIDHGAPLQPGELRLRYHVENSRMIIVPNSFMFQEGQRDVYKDAKYGVFKADGDSHLLTGLADANRKEITPP